MKLTPKEPAGKPRRKPSLFRYRGYRSFKVMTELHQELWPEEKSIAGTSRRASAIFRALDKAYTAGVGDTAHLDRLQLNAIVRKIERSSKP